MLCAWAPPHNRTAHMCYVPGLPLITGEHIPPHTKQEKIGLAPWYTRPASTAIRLIISHLVAENLVTEVKRVGSLDGNK